MKSTLFTQIKEIDSLKTIYLFAKKRKTKLYLVGGILRDLFLNRDKENLDLDFCLRRNAISFGQQLSRELKAGFVVLDKEHGACRLVKRVKDKVYTLDFTDFRDKTIEKDLLHRDFTINALALDLEQIFDKSSPLGMSSCIEGLNGLLIDPYGGKQDLKLKTIRAVNKKGFDEDPLRILRAYSFSAALGFQIEKETRQLIKLKANKLSEVSSERIRDELFKILDQPDAFDYLVQMDELKIIKTIIPEIETMRGLKQGPYHHLDVWRHTLETIKQLEILSAELKNRKEIKNYLDEIISGERKRRALLKLGALFHDIGKPLALRHEDGKTKFHGHEKIGLEMTQEIAKRLKLSNDELDALGKMVFWHLRPGYLADNEEITPRAKFRYFRDTAREAPSILLISIADQRSTRGPLTSKKSRIQHEEVALDLIKEYFRKKKEKPLPRLINGDDLIKHFKLAPSPLIGNVLAELDELQAIGKIKNRKDAFKAAEKFIQSHKTDLKKKRKGVCRMHKRLMLITIMVLALAVFVSQAQAKPPAAVRAKHADRNQDGVVDTKEIRMEKQWEQKQRSKVNSWWERRADTNNDGKVDSNELSSWKELTKERIDLNNDGVIDAKERRLSWRHARSRVNTALEKKYDANGDGWLEPAEVKELLKDRQTLIKTEGKAKVDTAIEEDYDKNEDGMIDAKEAEEMKEDTK